MLRTIVRPLSLLALLVVASLASAQSARPGPSPKTVADFKGATAYRVVRVVDGDTAVVRIEGKDTTVRLIGVDTPETVHPSKPVERFGKEASAYLKGQVEGKSVYLEFEAGASRLDKYGRTLAYLYTAPDARLVNLAIVAEGYGHAYTTYPFRYMETFREVERKARGAEKGLWGPEAEEVAGKPSGPATKAVAGKGGEVELAGMVYATKTGEKYHREGCRYLSKSSTPMTLAAASKKLAACSVCDPPSAPDEKDSPAPRESSRPSPASGGTTSGVCGATTKKGTPCQRRVADGGYCYQHR